MNVTLLATRPRRVALALATGLLINSMLAALVYVLTTPRPPQSRTRTLLNVVDFVRLEPSPPEVLAALAALPPPPPPAAAAPLTMSATAGGAPAAAKPDAAARDAAAAMPQIAALGLPSFDPPAANASGGASASGAGGTGGMGSGTGGAGMPVLNLRADDIDLNPVPSYKSPPVYPLRALTAGIEGRVTVEFTIDADGNVHEPRIANADPPGLFDQAVLDAITKWRFQPRLVAGASVARKARQAIDFHLRRDAP